MSAASFERAPRGSIGPVAVSLLVAFTGCAGNGLVESDEGNAWSLDEGTGRDGDTDAMGVLDDDGDHDPPDDGGDPVATDLDDEFDGDLGAWQVFGPSAARMEVEDGALHLEPAAQTVWFHRRTGVLLYKAVAGDFVMTSRVRARRLSDLSAPPPTPFRLGGLMARDPEPVDGENYVFIVIGADGNDLSVEHKTTQNGRSDYDGPPWPDAEGDLRVCRVGSTFVLLIRRDDTDAWHEVVRYERPDMPSTLQLGPTAYANNDDPDVRVSFDFVRFDAPGDLQDCMM